MVLPNHPNVVDNIAQPLTSTSGTSSSTSTGSCGGFHPGLGRSRNVSVGQRSLVRRMSLNNNHLKLLAGTRASEAFRRDVPRGHVPSISDFHSEAIGPFSNYVSSPPDFRALETDAMSLVFQAWTLCLLAHSPVARMLLKARQASSSLILISPLRP